MNQEKDLRLIQRFRSERDFFSREELVKKYLPMIGHILKKYNVPVIDFEDYFQEGAIGLLKAIEEYDPVNYTVKFSTFAYICILRRVFNFMKYSSPKKNFITHRVISLNAFLNEDESYTLIDMIPDENNEPLTRVEEGLIKSQLDAVLKAYLSPVEFSVLQMIINGYKMQDIQEVLSLSVKVIDNARTRARVKLKKILFRYGSLLSPQIPLNARKRKDLALPLPSSRPKAIQSKVCC